jgi:hypothetical protein
MNGLVNDILAPIRIGCMVQMYGWVGGRATKIDYVCGMDVIFDLGSFGCAQEKFRIFE